jgi:hypothetical protein
MPMFGPKITVQNNPNDVVADAVYRPVNSPARGAGSRASVTVVEFRNGAMAVLDSTGANPVPFVPGDRYTLYQRYERIAGDHGWVSNPPSQAR